MHVYVYDSYVNQPRYDKILARIETRITDLGLNGKIVRVGAMTKVHNIIDNELRRGASTVVILGNNKSICEALPSLSKQSVPLGVIPIGNTNNSIAQTLGIPLEEAACEILSARRIEKLDLGIINDACFLTSAAISTMGTVLTIENNFSLQSSDDGEINVLNLLTEQKKSPESVVVDPKDNLLNLLIQTRQTAKLLKSKKEEQLIFGIKSLTIENKYGQPVTIDESVKVATPAVISIWPRHLNIIVGKNRNF